MKEDITFEEGTHYTFDLKVGKDKVTIEQVSVNSNDPSIPFGDGWRSDIEEDLGAVSITDTQDEGKTALTVGVSFSRYEKDSSVDHVPSEPEKVSIAVCSP